jgi:hypothetical protein
MPRSRVLPALLALTLAATAATAQDRFLLDNLAYTAGATPVGPIAFGEAQFPVGTQVDGLAVSAVGAVSLPAELSFSFSLLGSPSTDAAVADFSLLPFLNLIDEMIEGNSGGVLGIDFGTTVSSVSFDFALQTFDTLAEGCTLTAFDAGGAPVATVTAPAESLVSYSEGQAGIVVPGGFRRVEIAFAGTYRAGLGIPTLSGVGVLALALATAAAGAIALRS